MAAVNPAAAAPGLAADGSRFPPADASGRLDALALYKGLVEVSALINGITEFNELLAAIMEVARRVMRAQGSALILLNERTGELEVVIARSADGEVVTAHQPIPLAHSIAGWVVEHGESVLVPDAYADPRFYAGLDEKTGVRTRSILCVPLCRRGAPIGALQAINAIGEGRSTFDAADQEAFEAFANLAATAIDKLRFLEEQRQRARFEQELAIATEIQKSFLPGTLPVRTDLAFAAHYRPALDVGGDFYDLFEVGPDELYFVIGDVAGKGVPAALLMAQSLSTLRLIIARGVVPAEALARWNQTLCRQSMRGLFITAVLGRITPSARTVEVVSAGHCQPWLVRGGGGEEPAIAEIQLRTAPPLAILPGARYESTYLTLRPGEWLVFFTDGLIDSLRSDGERLGSAGARHLLEKTFASPQQIVARLCDGEAAQRGSSPPQDDLTLLVFGFRA